MSFKSVKVDYSNFLEIRRLTELKSENKEAPTVFLTRESESFVEIAMKVEGREVFSILKSNDEMNHYKLNLKGIVNTPLVVDVESKNSHDFGDPSTWVYGPHNSIYTFRPRKQRVIYPHMFIAKFHQNDTLAQGTKMLVSIFESIKNEGMEQIPCTPEGTFFTVVSASENSVTFESDVSLELESGDRCIIYNAANPDGFSWVNITSVSGSTISTAEGFGGFLPVAGEQMVKRHVSEITPMFNPHAGVYEGYKLVYPQIYDPQHLQIFYYIRNIGGAFIPTHKVVVFEYDRVYDLRERSRNDILKDGIVESVTNYVKQGLKMGLRDVLNERIQISITGNQPINKLGGEHRALVSLLFKAAKDT